MKTLEWLERLIACDTTSRLSNLHLIEMVDDWCKRHHLSTRLTYDATGKKANLLASIPAHDGRITDGILLSGHTDVVPVDGQHWETDPFQMTVKAGKAYGRGASDMKGFLAVMLGLIPEWQQQKLMQPVHMGFSYDEEVGCLGAVHMVEDMVAAGIRPSVCIVGEPSEMHAVTGHKGIQLFRCRIHGLSAHSSLTPKGCNAIEYAAQLICFIRSLADKIRVQGPFDNDFDVPFSSISVNMIQGGTAHNIIPAICDVFFECRNLPHHSPQEIVNEVQAYVESVLQPAMQKEFVEARVVIEELAKAPSFIAADNDALIKRVRKLAGSEEVRKVAYVTEAGLFQAAGVPTVICGPGSIEQAHRPNEYVTIEQLQKCEEFLRAICLG